MKSVPWLTNKGMRRMRNVLFSAKPLHSRASVNEIATVDQSILIPALSESSCQELQCRVMATSPE